jgi:hypothetical protein
MAARKNRVLYAATKTRFAASDANGQKRTNRPGPNFIFVRFGPIADKRG